MQLATIWYCKGCTEGDVRLVEGTTRLEGRVEICKNNVWGTVCHRGWTSVDAKVVCRQLGYSATGELKLMIMAPLVIMYSPIRNHFHHIVFLWSRYWTNSFEFGSLYWI